MNSFPSRRRRRRWMPGSRTILSAAAIAAACVLNGATARGQTEKPPMAEEVFKNVQMLKGIPVKEFMGTMGFFSAATGMNCTQCHIEESRGNWARDADETHLERDAGRVL